MIVNSYNVSLNNGCFILNSDVIILINDRLILTNF